MEKRGSFEGGCYSGPFCKADFRNNEGRLEMCFTTSCYSFQQKEVSRERDLACRCLETIEGSLVEEGIVARGTSKLLNNG